MSGANDTAILRGVTHIVRRKAHLGELKSTRVTRRRVGSPLTLGMRPTHITSPGYTLDHADANRRASYSTHTSCTIPQASPPALAGGKGNLCDLGKPTTGDLRDTISTPTGNMDNVGANHTKNKDSIFQAICSVESLKIAYDQIKSKPGMMTPGTSKESLHNISNK